MRNRQNHLREVVRFLREADDKAKDKMPEDSVDDQIDKLLIDYEAAAGTVSTNEAFDLRWTTRRLLEAEAGDEKSEEGEATGAGESKLDVGEFAESVSRLVFNYDSLLEFRDTIAKRAYNYLLEKTSPDVAKEFLDVMRREHDVEIGKSLYDKEQDLEQPAAVRSGGSGGGA